MHDTQEYLYQLAESVRALAPASNDSHLFALEVSHRLFAWLCTSIPHRLWPRRDTYHCIIDSNQTTRRGEKRGSEKVARRPGEHGGGDWGLGVWGTAGAGLEQTL